MISMKVEDSSTSGETFDIGTRDHIKPIATSHNKSTLLDGSEEMTGAKARDDQNTVSPNHSYGAKTANGSSTSSMEPKAKKSVMIGSANEIPQENQDLKEIKPTLGSADELLKLTAPSQHA